MNEDTPIVNDHALSPTEISVQEMVTASGVTNSGVQTTASGMLSPFNDELDPMYIIRDRYFPDFHVRPTFQAWWKDVGKVKELIRAFKNGHSVEKAIVYAGISMDQYRYFKQMHPEFSHVKEACQSLLFLRGQEAIVGDMDNVETAKWFLARRDKRYRLSNPVDDDENEEAVPPPQQQVNINQGVIINQNGVTAEEIQKIGRELAAEIFGELRRDWSQRFEGGTDGNMEGTSNG